MFGSNAFGRLFFGQTYSDVVTTVRVSQETVETLIGGAGSARVSLETVETLIAGSGSARVSQETAETLIAGAGKARVTQLAVEVLRASSAALLSQETVEAVVQGTSKARLSQEAIEAVVQGTSKARLSQVAIEVVRSVSAARLSQTVTEVGAAGTAKARLSQTVIEVGTAGTSSARVSQSVLEAAIQTTGVTSAGVSQIVLEVALRQQFDINLPFIGSTTTVYGPSLAIPLHLPFIPSQTQVYPPQLAVYVPFISSKTRVFNIFSLFTDQILSGVGNGGENFRLKLAPNGTTVTASLAVSLTAFSTTLWLTGDSGLPTGSYCLHLEDEIVYVSRLSGGLYSIQKRGVANTTPASHDVGTDAIWTDSYDMSIVSGSLLVTQFTADILDSGSTIYPGWLIAFDSTQGYIGEDRYPMHITELVGVFSPHSTTNKLDASQPNAICTPTGINDDCPAALSVPARIASDIFPGDIGIVRYTNPEGQILELGSRAADLMSWFGLKRVSDTNVDQTFTNPNAHVVDTDPMAGPYTGSINGEWFEPLGPGIAPDTGAPVSNAYYTSVTLLGTNRYFTYGSPHYGDRGWPVCGLAVRQGQRRVPRWASWDWHNFNYVYTGFSPDATFIQILVNRNGIINASVPEVVLPGPQDIDGPDAIWDDNTYHFGASWYVIIYGTPYLLAGPSFTSGTSPSTGGGGGGIAPVGTVSFPGGSPNPVFNPPVEGGSGGGDVPGEPEPVSSDNEYATVLVHSR